MANNKTRPAGTPAPTSPTQIHRSPGTASVPGAPKHSAKRKRKKGPGLVRRFFEGILRRLFFGGRPIIARTDDQTIRELRRLGGLLKHHFEVVKRTGIRKTGTAPPF